MLKCEGGCQRYVDEYYQMPDLKIFCYDCWRQGKQLAENQYMQSVTRSDKMFLQNMFERKRLENELGQRVEQLQLAINLEKEKTARDWNDFGNDSNRKPYNYAEVSLMQDELVNMRNRLLNINSELQPIPRPSKYNIEYYRNAIYHAKSQISRNIGVGGNIDWMAMINAEKKRTAEREKERKNKEARQIKEINDGKFSIENIEERKEFVSKNINKITNKEVLVWLAQKTTSTTVIKKLLKMDADVKLSLISNNHIGMTILKSLTNDPDTNVQNRSKLRIDKILTDGKDKLLSKILEVLGKCKENRDSIERLVLQIKKFDSIVRPLLEIIPYCDIYVWPKQKSQESIESFGTGIVERKYKEAEIHLKLLKKELLLIQGHLNSSDEIINSLMEIENRVKGATDLSDVIWLTKEVDKATKQNNKLKKVKSSEWSKCSFCIYEYINGVDSDIPKEITPYPGSLFAFYEKSKWQSVQRRIIEENRKLFIKAAETKEKLRNEHLFYDAVK